MITILIALNLANTHAVSGNVLLKGKPVAEAVVWIEAAGTAKPISATITQKDKTFIPHISVVTPGSEVEFPNRDDFFHNVFAEYRAKKFDLGMFPKGATRKVVFDKTGPVSLLCNLHSNMSAYIMVVDSKYFCKTNRAGRFTLEGVPEGTHKIHGWHESGSHFEGSITVGANASEPTFTLAR